jgi:hypothetical protein
MRSVSSAISFCVAAICVSSARMRSICTQQQRQYSNKMVQEARHRGWHLRRHTRWCRRHAITAVTCDIIISSKVRPLAGRSASRFGFASPSERTGDAVVVMPGDSSLTPALAGCGGDTASPPSSAVTAVPPVDTAGGARAPSGCADAGAAAGAAADTPRAATAGAEAPGPTAVALADDNGAAATPAATVTAAEDSSVAPPAPATDSGTTLIGTTADTGTSGSRVTGGACCNR